MAHPIHLLVCTGRKSAYTFLNCACACAHLYVRRSRILYGTFARIRTMRNHLAPPPRCRSNRVRSVPTAAPSTPPVASTLPLHDMAVGVHVQHGDALVVTSIRALPSHAAGLTHTRLRACTH